MTAIKRADLPQVELRSEEVPVPSLGGDVVVRGLMLAEVLRLERLRLKEATPTAGESEDDARSRNWATFAAEALAAQVFDCDGDPLMTAAKWSIWAAANAVEFADLYNATARLRGELGEAKKN